jgi:hypothetical protein
LSNEFREFANECLDWAKAAKSDNERDIFLQMAQAWLEVAIRSHVGPSRADRARQEVVTRLASPTEAAEASDGGAGLGAYEL